MPRARKIAAIDCETDPFLYGRTPEPFLWGYYDENQFVTFKSTKEFVRFVFDRDIILFAHNGGKFDFIFLMPHLTETKAQIINGRIICMNLGKAELRDSYAIIPVALRELGSKKEIDYAKLERENRNRHWDEIGEYLYWDCKGLYTAVATYRDIAGKHKTIASNALGFSKRIGIDPGKTNHRFDTNFRPFYFGGRTECLQPGTHNNITICDIRSAYPWAMQQDHATGDHTDFLYRGDDFGDLTREEIERSFIVLECFAKGCFPIRSKGAEGLHFPNAFGEYHVTGWEYIAAIDLGLIYDVTIKSVRYSNKKLNFAGYVDHWFRYKAMHNKKTQPMEYTIGKIMMNSLYGKLAQNPARYFDYKIVLAGTKIDAEEGWTLEHEYDNHEIHRRESLWKYKFTYGKDWVSRNIYKNVATGASVTGCTRALLLRSMHKIGISNVIYTDTDSIICHTGYDKLSIGEALGQWEIEAENCPVGHFAGKKLYGIRLPHDGPDGKSAYKIASKGAKLTFAEIAEITKGSTITWRSDAPHFSLGGKADFVVRNIRSTAAIPLQSNGD